MKYYLSILAWLLLCCKASSQSPPIDQAAIDAKLDAAFDGINSGKARAMEWMVVESLSEATRAHYEPGIAMAYNFLGLIMRDDNRLDSAMVYFSRSLALREKLRLTGGAANVRRNIASVYRLKGDYERAMEYALQALNQHEQLDDTGGISGDYLEIANIYENEGSLEHSNLWLKKRWIEAPEMPADILENAKTAYSIANNYLYIQLDSSLMFAQTARQLYDAVHDKTGVLQSEGILADVYSRLGRYQDAAILYSTIEAKITQIPQTDTLMLFSWYNNYGYFLSKIGKFREALQQLEKAGAVLGEKERFPAKSEKLALNKAEVFLHLQQLDSALYYQSEANRFTNLLYDTKKAESIVRLGTEKIKTDLEKSTLQLAGQQRQNNLLRTILAVLCLACLLVYFAWQQLKKNIIIEKQQAQLHFQEVEKLIRNEELNTRIQLIQKQDKERLRLASELHEGVGGALMTMLLDLKNTRRSNQQQMQETLEQSIETINQTYSSIREISHEMRSGELARLNIQAAIESLINLVNKNENIAAQVIFHGLEKENIPPDIGNHLYRISQELVANTLKHAEASEVALQLNRFQNDITLIYEDNGKGFVFPAPQGGIGLQNLEDRVHSLGGTITFDTSPGNGFTCFVNIPLPHTNHQYSTYASED